MQIACRKINRLESIVEVEGKSIEWTSGHKDEVWWNVGRELDDKL